MKIEHALTFVIFLLLISFIANLPISVSKTSLQDLLKEKCPGIAENYKLSCETGMNIEKIKIERDIECIAYTYYNDDASGLEIITGKFAFVDFPKGTEFVALSKGGFIAKIKNGATIHKPRYGTRNIKIQIVDESGRILKPGQGSIIYNDKKITGSSFGFLDFIPSNLDIAGKAADLYDTKFGVPPKEWVKISYPLGLGKYGNEALISNKGNKPLEISGMPYPENPARTMGGLYEESKDNYVEYSPEYGNEKLRLHGEYIEGKFPKIGYANVINGEIGFDKNAREITIIKDTKSATLQHSIIDQKKKIAYGIWFKDGRLRNAIAPPQWEGFTIHAPDGEYIIEKVEGKDYCRIKKKDAEVSVNCGGNIPITSEEPIIPITRRMVGPITPRKFEAPIIRTPSMREMESRIMAKIQEEELSKEFSIEDAKRAFTKMEPQINKHQRDIETWQVVIKTGGIEIINPLDPGWIVVRKGKEPFYILKIKGDIIYGITKSGSRISLRKSKLKDYITLDATFSAH